MAGRRATRSSTGPGIYRRFDSQNQNRDGSARRHGGKGRGRDQDRRAHGKNRRRQNLPLEGRRCHPHPQRRTRRRSSVSSRDRAFSCGVSNECFPRVLIRSIQGLIRQKARECIFLKAEKLREIELFSNWHGYRLVTGRLNSESFTRRNPRASSGIFLPRAMDEPLCWGARPS